MRRLGYIKFLVKETVMQILRKCRLRRNNYIGKKCYIEKDTVLTGNNRISDFCILGREVYLGKNVAVGRWARISNISIGENSVIESGVICTGYGNGKITVGNESYIGLNNILDFSDSISIGNFVHIAGPATGVWTHSSARMCLNNIPLKNKETKYRPTAPILIEDNVYIGGNCTIYPGIKIGHHSIITPNSVVNTDVKPYTQVGGVPAKVIKQIK